MAKNSGKQRQRRRAIVKARSRQARENETLRTDPNPRDYSDRNLNRLTDEQLRAVAMDLGRQYGQVQHQAQAEARRQYYNVPQITLSKHDLMYAARPDISAQQIASLPPRKAKLARQQKKRHDAAVDKIHRMRRYDAMREQRTIAQERDRERLGMDVAETGLSQSTLQGYSDVNADLSTKNVLTDTPFLKSMEREVLQREVQDVARKLGKPVRETAKPKEYRHIKVSQPQGMSRNQRREYEDVVFSRKLRAIDPRLAKRWNRLNKKQRYMLRNATAVEQEVNAVIGSPPKSQQKKSKNMVFVFRNDSAKDRAAVATKISDYFDSVAGMR